MPLGLTGLAESLVWGPEGISERDGLEQFFVGGVLFKKLQQGG